MRGSGVAGGNPSSSGIGPTSLPAAFAGEANVDPSDAGSNHPDAKPGARGAAKIRRLIANQQCFGLGAKAFHDGAERTLGRVSGPAAEPARIDVHSLSEDFRLDADASWRLLCSRGRPTRNR